MILTFQLVDFPETFLLLFLYTQSMAKWPFQYANVIPVIQDNTYLF